MVPLIWIVRCVVIFKAATLQALPEWINFRVDVDACFIMCFFLLDQLICALLLFRTLKGPSAPWPRPLIAHIVYGFLNSKTYFVVVLLHLRGNLSMQFNEWILNLLLAGLFFAVCQKLYPYNGVFYLQHRMCHLPVVYEQAHKFHHFLHDTTGFDAHFFGSGAPEEWLALTVELLAWHFFGLQPISLSGFMIIVNLFNKHGHVRIANDALGVNFHCDHHVIHRANFASPLADILFDTQWKLEEFVRFGGSRVYRKALEDSYILTFSDAAANDPRPEKDLALEPNLLALEILTTPEPVPSTKSPCVTSKSGVLPSAFRGANKLPGGLLFQPAMLIRASRRRSISSAVPSVTRSRSKSKSADPGSQPYSLRVAPVRGLRKRPNLPAFQSLVTSSTRHST